MSEPSAPNYIQIIANACIFNAAGELVQSGSLSVLAVDGHGNPVAFTIGGGGIALKGLVRRQISGGSLEGELWLANPAHTNPTSIGYTFTIADLNRPDLQPTCFPKVAITDSGSGFDLAALEAGDYETAVPVTYVTGPQGPPGGSATPLDLTAAVNISGSLAVAAIAGDAVLADSSTLAHRDCVIGLATVTTLSGQPVEVQFEGEFTFSGWNWTLGMPVVLGLNGALTQTTPTTGFLQVIGTPLSSTSLLLNLQPPITLA